MVNTLPNFLKNRAFLTPDRTAIYFEDGQLTFKELYQRSVSLAGRLAWLGIEKGSYTGVLVKSNLETAVLLYALQLIGVPAVMLNNRLTVSELSWQMKDAGARFLICDESLKELGAEAAACLSEVKAALLQDLQDVAPADISIPDELSLTDVCTVMYTSGTTGNPKGVLQTYGNHWWSATGSALNLGLMDSDIWLCSVPLFHISGYSILMKSIIYGMPIVLHSQFDEEKTIKDIDAKKVTVMSVVSATLSRILDSLDGRGLPEHFRCMLLGGGPAPLPLLESCLAQNIPVFQTFGMTETSSQSATLSPEYSISKLGSAGKPLFPVAMKIVLPDGGPAGAGEAGEILIKGPNVTPGYLNRPEETEAKIVDGWLHSGDIGYLDEEGFLFVLDRRSDLIISGGENIYPAEIESILLSYPGIAEAGVTGVPDMKWGQVPVAFIVPSDGQRLDENGIREFCRGKLAKYKVPKDFYFVQKLPRNASNKLLRRKLPELIGDGDK